MSWFDPHSIPLIRCRHCQQEHFKYQMRHTRDGPLCHDCWTKIRVGRYEKGGGQKRRYRDPQQRRD